MMKMIDVKTLRERMARDEVLLIDVREVAEYQTDAIAGSCLIPLGEISLEKIPSKSRPIVIHCRSGKRSQQACDKILAQDPDLDVYNLEGGILAWEAAGYPIHRGGRKVIPIDRQTQIGVGSLIFSGFLLGAFVNPKFFLMCGFFGAGLIFAGASGWCGMAKILAKMPWNR